MSFRTHHGKQKITDVKEVDNLSIVLTTYQTVSADWKGGDQRRNSVLYSKHWHRVILDEGMVFQLRVWYRQVYRTVLTVAAHFIRNERNRMSRAVCHLEARARWAVTGTPVQVSMMKREKHTLECQ